MLHQFLNVSGDQLGPIRRVQADFSALISRRRETVQTKWRRDGVDESIIERALSVLHPTGIPFLDLCLYKGRFPSAQARFCTQELKLLPLEQQVYGPVLQAGNEVVSWVALRRQESVARARLAEKERVLGFLYAYDVYRPLLDWTVEQVFAMHTRHQLNPNPLYSQGMERVGCMPCILAKKEELYEISARWPEEIERVAEWERIVSMAAKRGSSSFFTSKDGKKDTIGDAVAWSRTLRGGVQLDLFRQGEDLPGCSSIYGLCE